MVDNADALVLFKEYPHTDVGERAAELFDLCLRKHRGEIDPVMAVPMGTTVWLSNEGGVDLVLNSIRTQVLHPYGLTQLGIEPSGYRGIVVKSTQHFYAGLAPLAGRIEYVACEGAIPPDFTDIPYRKFLAPYWPRIENPF